MSDNSYPSINFDNTESQKVFEIYSQTMCPRYKIINESGFVAHLNITNNEHAFFVKGNLQYPSLQKVFVKYTAPNPPTYSSNFSGSGMPYPNEDIAFDNTPNRGVVEVINGKFSFTLKYPNSYYINMGTVYVEPHVKILLVDSDNKHIGNIHKISLGNGIPFRTLTYPKLRDEKGVLFYQNSGLPVRTQHQILLDSAYPIKNEEPANFWGLKPVL